MKLNHLRYTGNFPKETAHEIYLEISKMEVGDYLLTITDNKKVFPEMVSVVDQENGYLGVSYIQIVPVLLESIKEQQSEIDLLKKEIVEINKLLHKKN